jgi:iron complex outermembrane receptor protein
VRGVATGYYYRIDDLINLTLDPADDLLVFRNLDEVEAFGLELELEGRSKSGLEGRISYSAQQTENRRTGEELSNSPRHLAKLNLIFPVWQDHLFLAAEEHYTSSRKTITGNRTGGFAVTNLTLYGRKILPGLEFSASVYNLLDKRFRDPVSAAHLQDTIEQDGRGFRGKLTCSF